MSKLDLESSEGWESNEMEQQWQGAYQQMLLQ